MTRKEGIGSYFHDEDPKKMRSLAAPLRLNYNLYYTGRHALLSILNSIAKTTKINTIWFPNYYCQHTLAWIKKSYSGIKTYEINPFEFSNDTIDIGSFADNKDVVLVNNYWGLSSMSIKNKPQNVVVIEDHSHGWLSEACLNSHADYCFVSLRKSLPIPLGGVAWQPHLETSSKQELVIEDQTMYGIWNDMLRGMQLKTQYIKGTSPNKDYNYLPVFYKVEEALNSYFDFAKMLNEHKTIIESFINANTLSYKEEHLRYLYKNIKDNQYFKIVKKNNKTAFGLLLLFKEAENFNSLKQYLVSQGIYPSALWPDNKVAFQWCYFLNIHVDYRYNKYDMEHIATTIKGWLKKQD